jgi:hypothetical protein
LTAKETLPSLQCHLLEHQGAGRRYMEKTESWATRRPFDHGLPFPGNSERAGHRGEAVGPIGGIVDSRQGIRAGLQANAIGFLPVRVRFCDGRNETLRICATAMKGLRLGEVWGHPGPQEGSGERHPPGESPWRPCLWAALSTC